MSLAELLSSRFGSYRRNFFIFWTESFKRFRVTQINFLYRLVVTRDVLSTSISRRRMVSRRRFNVAVIKRISETFDSLGSSSSFEVVFGDFSLKNV